MAQLHCRRFGVLFGQRPGVGPEGRQGKELRTSPEFARSFMETLKRWVSSANGEATVCEIPATVTMFADGEPRIEIDQSIRGMHIIIVAQFPVRKQADALMELLVLIDAVSRSSPAHITLVLPYFPYARQDRQVRSRTPITAAMVASMLSARLPAGSHVVMLDLHSGQTQGFFASPHISSEILLARMLLIQAFIAPFVQRVPHPTIVSPDAGGLERVRAMISRIHRVCSLEAVDGPDVAAIFKHRPGPNVAEIVGILGNVQGRDCLIIDDMIDTAGTLVAAALALIQAGATSVEAVSTHGVLAGQAVRRICESPLRQVHLLDTIPLRRPLPPDRFTVVTCAPFLATATFFLHFDRSLTALMEDPAPEVPPLP